MNNLTSSIEDYPRAIYEIQLEGDQKPVSTLKLAEKLGVARASISGMLKKLAAWDLQPVKYKRYHRVALSTTGEKIALEITRHHRLIESLGYSWDAVLNGADHLSM